MLVIISIFNNSEDYIERYFQQVKEFNPYLILLEGDSTDNTYSMLQERIKQFDGILLKRDKGKVYDSVIDKRRFKQLADLWNELLDLIPEEATKVCLIESDLIWQPSDLSFLLELVEDYNFVCPYIIRDNKFYDIWGYRYLNKIGFEQDLGSLANQIEQLHSAGSFLVMQADIARQNRISEKNAVVGFCESAKEDLFCIPIYVWHP